MWGNAFADLAKKAQDLQEQAKEQASQMATPSFFNLDSMQDEGGEEQGMLATPHHPAAAAAFTVGTPDATFPFKQSSTPSSSTMKHKPTVVKKLDMEYSHDTDDVWNSFGGGDTPQQHQVPATPPKKVTVNVTPSTSTAVSATTRLKVPDTAHIASVPSTESNNNGGWNDDNDLLLDLQASTSSNEDGVQQRESLVKESKMQVQSTKEQSTIPPKNEMSSVEKNDETKSGEPALQVETATRDMTRDETLLVVENESIVVEESTLITPKNDNTDTTKTTPSSERPMWVETAASEDTVPIETQGVFANAFVSTKQDDDDEPPTPLADDTVEGFENASSDADKTNDKEEEEETTQQSVMNDGVLHDEKVEEAPTLQPQETEDETSAPKAPTIMSVDKVTERAKNEPVDENELVTTPADFEEEVFGNDDVAAEESTFPALENGFPAKESIAVETIGDMVAAEVAESPPEISHEPVESGNEAAAALEEQKDLQEDVAETPVEASATSIEESKDLVEGNQDEHITHDATAVPEQPVSTASDAPPAPQPPASPLTASGVTQEQHELELQQLHESHQAEIAKLSQQHENQLQEMLASFNHDHCQQRQEVEQRFMDQIRAKEQQLQELMKENEGYQLKIDVLKREVTGTQELLEQRDSAIGSVNASHNKNVELLEQRIKEMNDAASRSKAEAERVKEELQSTKTELGTSNEAYTTLKARVKVVATELKERRVECRTLSATATQLTQSNEQLETQIVNLQSQLKERVRTQAEKDSDLKQARERIEALELQLHKTESELQGREAVGEKALSTYKKKAQNALAVANARAAAANQAKEEAEREAVTARQLSEEAIARARVAENAGNQALAEAKEYVREMETEKLALEKELMETKDSLDSTTAESAHLQNQLDASKVAQEKLVQDVKELTHDREEERSRNVEMRQQLDESQQRLELLYEEVETLREDLRQANALAASSSGDANEKESRGSTWTHHTRSSDEIPERSDAEGTIVMLEGELRDANRAIKELKDALKNAIAEQQHGSNGYGNGTSASASAIHHHGNSTGPAGNESTPLFFAMEKQAELNTARDEINRLANLLGDAESSKMEAYEAMDEMRRRMQEAEARLHRHEKFEGTVKPPTTSSAPQDGDDENANLEYLKNIMMSYLNAKTLAEKKALIPVISAVLCLTPEEQAAALKNLDESGGIEGVGMALFESFGSIRR